MEMGNFLNHVKMAGVLVAGICFLVPGFSAEVRVSEPIPLDQVANMGFADDDPDDGKGGWNDQGSENDLRSFTPGKLTLRGIRFDVTDPAKNGGKGCLVLSLERTPKQKSAVVRLERPRRMNYLALLHATAWTPLAGTPIGSVVFHYEDGSRSEVVIRADEHVGNWWSPGTLSNGRVAWRGFNKYSDVGLYLSEIPVEAKPVTEIEFICHPRELTQKPHQWMIVGISSTDLPIPREERKSYRIVESDDWKPFRYNPAEIEKGSPMDFSWLLDAPAGKHGRIVVRNGHFEFENQPGKPLRFYGVNLSETSNFPEKKNAAKVADAIARSGYNCVRIHHHDNHLAAVSPEDRTELNPEMIDRLDYLVKELKERGIYITLDLFVSRQLPMKYMIGKDVRDYVYSLRDYKRAVFISDVGMENLLKFSRNWLNHVNPYTGVAWKEEPALAFISLVNEDPLTGWSNMPPEIQALYNQKLEEFLAAHDAASATGKEREALTKEFMVATHQKGFRKIESFLRDLGVRCPISDQNCNNAPLLQNSRVLYDYVDNHFYASHPWSLREAWRLPSVVTGPSNLGIHGGADFTPGLANRVYGKPYTITEFSFCKPNSFRAENGPFIGAYAALQGWDGLFRFQWAWADKVSIVESTGGYFDIASDPIALLSDKIGMLLFVRGDVATSDVTLTMIQNDDFNVTTADLPPEIAQKIGFVARTGMVLESDGRHELPPENDFAYRFEEAGDAETMLEKIRKNVDLGAGKIDLKRKSYVSTTGEVALDTDRAALTVVTPRSETLVRSFPGEAQGNVLEVRIPEKSATVCAAGMDGNPLRDSTRILFFHLTDATESGIQFANEGCTILERWGGLPHLARRGIAEVTLHLAPAGDAPRVFALDLFGRRIEEVKSAWNPDGTLRFEAAATGGRSPRFLYEILR